MRILVTVVGFLCLLSFNALAQVNYTFSASTTTFTALSSASQFTWTTTSANDEEYSSATNIFDGTQTFTYAGTSFTQFQVSTNGFIRMGTGLASATSADALSGTLRGVIAPLWDNLSVSTTLTDITYKVTGSAGNFVLTVEWKNVKWNNAASSANAEFQVKLYEATGVIEFVYGTMGTPNAGSASIGLADNSTISSTTNPSTGKFLSINVGGSPSSRVYHQSRGYIFNAINNAPDSNTLFTFTPVTPSAIGTGTYTVGGTTPTYSTLSEAAQALNIHGISGPVVLNVRTGTYDDIFHLTNVSGTSSTNTITLKNESGAVTLVPRNGSGTSTAGAAFSSDAIIRLDGTQYTTVQGLTLNDNGLATTALKFAVGVMLGNSVATDGTMGSGGRFNTLKNLTIDMKATAGANHTGAICIRYFTSSSTETDTGKTTSYNRIENCTLTGFWRAAWKNFGINGTNPDRGNVITGSTIGNFTISSGTGSDVRALEMDCQSSLTIENNTIENIDVSIMTTNNIYGIWFNPAGSATNLNSGSIVIRNNTIRNLENSGAGTTTGFAVGISSNNVANNTAFEISRNRIYDIYSNGNGLSRAVGLGLFMSTGTPTSANIFNNMISDLRCPRSTSTPGVRGMDLQNIAGNATFNVYYNTVYVDNTVAPTNSAHRSSSLHGASLGTAAVDLRNNIMINTQSTSTGISPVLYFSANSNLLRLASTTDYNLYYAGTPSSSKPISYDGTTSNDSLVHHRTAVASGGLGGPRDVNSKSKTVSFVSSADLHLSGGSLGDTELIGNPIGGYTTDIDGETRHASFPYIGADENTSNPLPVQFVAFTATVTGSGVALRWETASEVDNYGFEVERRAIQSGSWERIAFVRGAGNSVSSQVYTYHDLGLAAGRYAYRIKQIDRDGRSAYYGAAEIEILSLTPKELHLSSNYPNPFNPSTTIEFTVAEETRTVVSVYNLTGEEVAVLFDQIATPGSRYSVRFDATGMASGLYFYRLSNGASQIVKKMLYLR